MNHVAHIPTFADSTRTPPDGRVRSTAVTAARSGWCMDLLKPDACGLPLYDIANALARIPWRNGATLGTLAFSLAQHAVIVASIVPGNEALRRAALLRQAHLAFTGALTPAMAVLLGRRRVQEIEQDVQAAILERFGVNPALAMDDRLTRAVASVDATLWRDQVKAPAWPFEAAPDATPLPQKLEAQAVASACTYWHGAAMRLGLGSP